MAPALTAILLSLTILISQIQLGQSAKLNPIPLLTKRAAHHSLHKRGEGKFPGRATFYDPGLGACGQTNGPGDFIVALNQAQYTANKWCNKKIKIFFGGKSTEATIVDECPGCPENGLDMSPSLFEFFASKDVGVFYMSWSLLDGSSDGPDPAPKPAPPPPPPHRHHRHHHHHHQRPMINHPHPHPRTKTIRQLRIKTNPHPRRKTHLNPRKMIRPQPTKSTTLLSIPQLQVQHSVPNQTPSLPSNQIPTSLPRQQVPPASPDLTLLPPHHLQLRPLLLTPHQSPIRYHFNLLARSIQFIPDPTRPVETLMRSISLLSPLDLWLRPVLVTL
ncbi:hypothetical protein PTTG_06113 [Puccinia triticina 1-1 BBBD Race 1]|uniref:RlpA-like protein double-psi beta-barrel domain-containing protein n=1 Tax=Puccinia triticina (isolate 1-1 / race 1 (BBBD)) TaxID=630390 RepID=A0A180G9Q6_PUCT1|nr:hypothetical protein PTTG_06113 [Puccinia triticina 1-1 BBBD Race 1]